MSTLYALQHSFDYCAIVPRGRSSLSSLMVSNRRTTRDDGRFVDFSPHHGWHLLRISCFLRASCLQAVTAVPSLPLQGARPRQVGTLPAKALKRWPAAGRHIQGRGGGGSRARRSAPWYGRARAEAPHGLPSAARWRPVRAPEQRPSRGCAAGGAARGPASMTAVHARAVLASRHWRSPRLQVAVPRRRAAAVLRVLWDGEVARRLHRHGVGHAAGPPGRNVVPGARQTGVAHAVPSW